GRSPSARAASATGTSTLTETPVVPRSPNLSCATRSIRSFARGRIHDGSSVARNGPSTEGASGTSNEPSSAVDVTRATTWSHEGTDDAVAETRTGCHATSGASTESEPTWIPACATRPDRALAAAARHADRTFGDWSRATSGSNPDASTAF